MTGTMPAPAPPAPGPPSNADARPAPDPGAAPGPPPTALLAELALLGVSLATVVGYARLFADGAFLAPIAAAAVGGHVLAAVLRRRGLGPLSATAVHLAALPLFVTWLRYRGTTARLLPTGRTLDHVGNDLAAAWDIFLDVAAPVPSAPGFVVTAMVAAWVVALVSDSIAFRLHATVEALAPATGLFLFSSILAEREHRTVATVLFLAAVLAFVLTARVARADHRARWLATDAGRGTRSLLTTGAGLAAVAVLAAVVVGPRLPGGDGDPLVDLDGTSGGADRVTLSPLVDIRSRLVDQDDVEAFRVEAASPSYWRLTALDRFDGQIWSSSGSYVGVDGRLPSTPSDAPGATRLTQTFRIGALDQIWLPAAFEPVAVNSPDAEVDWDDDSSSLVVDTDRDTSDGLEYQVLSILPRLRPDDLATGTAGLDTEFLDRFTRLPDAARPIADRYAAQAVGARTGAYDQAVALQDWFRTRFTYSLDIDPGHGTDALTAFLDPAAGRSGYCEQFAGAYAALARALGLPARVAVGFTPGEEQADEPGTYVVRGRHAHAWPEVYFTGVGWVAFEPTPGRGAPGAQGYTGVAAAQAAPRDPATPSTLPAPVTTGSAPTRPQRVEDLDLTPAAGDAAGDGGVDLLDLLRGALVVAGLCWIIGVPVAGALRRRRRRRRARGHPDREVGEAWARSVRAMALIDLVPTEAETPREFARRAAADAGTDRPTHEHLADLTTVATYGAVVTATDVAQARSASSTVVARARRLAGPWRRLRAGLSARRQWKG